MKALSFISVVVWGVCFGCLAYDFGFNMAEMYVAFIFIFTFGVWVISSVCGISRCQYLNHKRKVELR